MKFSAFEAIIRKVYYSKSLACNAARRFSFLLPKIVKIANRKLGLLPEGQRLTWY